MSSPSPRPLALSDSEITTIMAAARPLSPADRQSYLEHVAAVLAKEPVLGDGVVSRIVREAFKQRWAPPELNGKGNNHLGKYGR